MDAEEAKRIVKNPAHFGKFATDEAQAKVDEMSTEAARRSFKEILDDAERGKATKVTKHGTVRAVICSPDDYNPEKKA